MSAPAELSERLASLTPAQRALFELALKKKEQAPPPAASAPALTIPRRRRQSPCVLSVDQERVWFVQQLDPESPVFNVYNALRFSGRIEPAALDRALNEVVRRQEILRAWFTVIDGTPMQVIEPALPVTLPCIDLRALPDEARDAEAQRIATGVVTPAIPMDRPPLFRIVLMQLADDDFVLPSCIHHIIIDWVSFYSFTTELTVLYRAFLEGRPSPLPELPVQYPDYAEWQRDRLSDPAVTEGLIAWWKERLADAPELLPLPIDRPRPAAQTPWGRRSPLTLSAAHSGGLRELSQREGATLFTVLLAVLKATLSRLTGEEKLIVGTPSGHRIQPELQEVLGFFLNQLVFYTDLTGNPSLLDVVRRVKETAVGAYAHEELPFPRLVEALRPGRDLSRTPFTQVVLLLLNPQQMAEQLGGEDPSAGLGVGNYWVDAHRTQFDMTLSFWESRSSPVLSGWWEHNTDLFDATTMDRMKEQFRMMVAAFVSDPGRPLWDVPLLTGPQRQQLLVEWAGGALPAAGPPLPERVAAHAARAPESEALVFEDRVLTYGELDRRSNRLAHALRRLGVGPESLVGLRIERSPEMLVAVLAVWKAGGAYVPLDPGLPEARLAYLVQDSGASPVLTGEKLAELEAGALSEAPLEPLAGMTNAAYVIYTSGSTGNPKGVVVEHGNMLATLEAGRRFLGLTAADRVSCLASFSFDATVYDMYTPLLAGACVHLFGLRPALDFERLVASFDRLTVLHAVPVLMRQIVELARPAGPFPGLREVQMGADRVPPDLAAEVAEVFPRANVRVLYGPTETTVICAQGLLSEYGAGPRVGAPIGRPIESAEVRLLDRRGGPVPPNVAGEVWVGGPGVARGYLDRPELTAEKFPLLDGRRFYRTGDLARWRGDGLLEFLGRADQQVKVRGFRIEPGEIEAALTARPEVKEAVVTARDGSRLVAYVVPGDGEVSTEALRGHLRERLPEYMVPAAWVVLPSLPLTSTGKVDRKALPEPEAPAAGGEEALPRTPVEERLAAIWSEVLGVPQVGVRDNFFTLGGDSILSIQVITRAQRDGIALTPRMLFQYQTVAELAAAAGSVGGVKAEQGPVTGPVSFTPIQRWFFDQKPPEPWHDNQALLLESRRRLDPARLDAALARIGLHHDALRLRFRRGVIGWEQWGAVPEGTSPLLTVDLSALPEAACRPQIEAAAAAAQLSLDLSQGPLHRPVLFDLGEGRPGRFLWVIHHLVVDGVSWRLLLEDLAAAYDQLPLPAKTTSYKEWSEHLADFSESEVLRRETDWWLERPWGEVAPLPADGPAVAFRETLVDERSVSLSLDAEETRALLQEVPRVYNSQINDALLSSLARAFQAWTGSPVLLLDLEGHGREEIFPDVDLSRTVGWFTSVFPVLLDLRGAAGPGEALKAVKEHLRRIPNGGLGWGVLQASPESGRIARLPRPEVGFNYLGQVDQGLPSDLPFGGARESAGPNRSPWAPRAHRLEWNGSVSGGRLRFACAYAEGTFRRDTVERLVQGLGTALRELIEHCRTPEAGGYTPSDFPLAGLSQGQLDKLLARRKKPQ